jgi:broad specificity phosphatase PhoE
MSELVLVRHGQASFFSENYDALSTLGEEQSRRLGECWGLHASAWDEVYVGPRVRQRQTAQLTGESYRIAAGLSWPEPVVLPELDEYDLPGLLDRMAPALAREDPMFEDLWIALHESAGERERTARFQRMFESLLHHWQIGSMAADVAESWLAFRDRVRRGLERMTQSPGRGRNIVAFTSGGVIGTMTGFALAAPDRTSLELNWRLRNASLTRLIFSNGRLSLDEFNTVPHLPNPSLWTYR